MMEKRVIKELASLISQVLHSSCSEDKGREILNTIANKLMSCSDPQRFVGEDEFCDFGLKISAQSAAGCMPQYFRTTKYWRALLNAIADQSAGQTLRILYPGCGPFATLVLPILTMPLKSRVELVLLDANAQSLENARKLWQSVDHEQLFVTFVQSDVLKFKDDNLFDIVIFECLLKALEDEAQVAITLHVSQMLQASGKIIPKSIECHLVGSSLRAEIQQLSLLASRGDDAILEAFSPFRERRVLIFKLDKNTWNDSHIVDDIIDLGQFDLSTLTGQHELLLTTVMQLDDEITIQEYQCGLTYPTYVDWKPSYSDIVNLGYRLRPMPQFCLQN